MQNLDFIADQINSYNFFLGEPNSFNFDLKRFEEISNEKIKQVTESYLSKPFVELHIIPKRKDKFLMQSIDRSVKPVPSEEISFSLPEIEKFKLNNNLEVFFIQKTKLPILQLNLLINAGSFLDPANKKGLSNLFSIGS